MGTQLAFPTPRMVLELARSFPSLSIVTRETHALGASRHSHHPGILSDWRVGMAALVVCIGTFNMPPPFLKSYQIWISHPRRCCCPQIGLSCTSRSTCVRYASIVHCEGQKKSSCLAKQVVPYVAGSKGRFMSSSERTVEIPFTAHGIICLQIWVIPVEPWDGAAVK
jgi:hypothetical protein